MAASAGSRRAPGGDFAAVPGVAVAVAPATDAGPGPTRVLCLGNELIADDALGIVVGHRLCRRLAAEGTRVAPRTAGDPAVSVRAFELPGVGRVEVVATALTGMYLLDAVVGASRLVVVDTVATGAADPGTVLELGEQDLVGPRGGSPHYVGLLEALDLARGLGLAVPSDVVFVAVEAGDSTTVGGRMTASVRAALPAVVERVTALVEGRAIAAG
jgi:hydrogenase maturation protease